MSEAPMTPVTDPVRMAMLKHITGWLTPVYTEHLPNGRDMHAIGNRDDFQRIQDGYACGQCCATFDTYMQVCPACGLNRDDAARVDKTPDEWNVFYDEHLNGGVTGRANTPDEFLRSVNQDRDIERVELSRLRPSSVKRLRRN